jgi:hypothetical protein
MLHHLPTPRDPKPTDQSMLATLCAILHMGNLAFAAVGDDACAVDAANGGAALIDLCGRILGVSNKVLRRT